MAPKRTTSMDRQPAIKRARPNTTAPADTGPTHLTRLAIAGAATEQQQGQVSDRVRTDTTRLTATSQAASMDTPGNF